METIAENKIAGMAPLVKRVREFLAERQKRTSLFDSPINAETLTGKFGFAERKNGNAEIILGQDVAVELGHPSTESRAIVLLTSESDKIENGNISIVGPDVGGLGGGAHHAFAQVVMLAVRPGAAPDPFALDNTQYLMNRLPGYMARTVPGRLWVRFSNSGMAAGLNLATVGSALIAAYVNDFESVEKAEVVFVTSGREDVQALSQVAIEADILAGKHKNLALGIDGEIECAELNCDICDEKPVCDNLRDIVIKRRKQTK